ncbi:MAG: HAD hydrolase-like protein, partial [Muribaculaceae bacterium]|nr:HAD hydrolase-like protein [Muribaculaceae bacterium]
MTGSGQASLIDSVRKDYPGVFGEGMMVTAHDVTKGKPNPEPYLRGLEKAGVNADEAIVVENAPLG